MNISNPSAPCLYLFSLKTTEVSYRSRITTAKPLQFTDNTLLLEVPSVAHRDYWNKIWQIKQMLSLKKHWAKKLPFWNFRKNQKNPFTIAEEEIKAEEQAAQSAHSDVLDFSVKQITSSNASESQLNEKYTFDTFCRTETELAWPMPQHLPSQRNRQITIIRCSMMEASGSARPTWCTLSETAPARQSNARIKYVSSEAFATFPSIRSKAKIPKLSGKNIATLTYFWLMIHSILCRKRRYARRIFPHVQRFIWWQKTNRFDLLDRLPNEIPQLQKGSFPVFVGDFQFDITPPDFETRTAISCEKKRKATFSTFPMMH